MKMPQRCPKCGVDLTDPNLPPEMAEYRDQFSLVLMDKDEFQCPVCKATWPRGSRRDARRSRNPARRR